MDDLSHSIQKETKKNIDLFKYYLKKIIQKIKPKKFRLFKNCDKIETKDIYEDNKNQITTKKSIIKKRIAGIYLLRIISMIGIVYNHVLFKGKGIYKYNIYKSKIKSSLTYLFWHDNVYALISGIVGYKSTKYSNLFYLWLSVVFYSLGIHYYYLNKKGARVSGELYRGYYPAVYGRYWYFSSYVGMFFFLPAINKGIQYLNKSEFNLLVMSIFGIFVFWHTYHKSKNDYFKINGGLSTIWLLCLYIMGAYIGKFNIKYTGIKNYIICFVYFLIFLFLCNINNKYTNYTILAFNVNFKTKMRNFIKRLISNNLNSVIKTSQAFLITLFFLQLKYNKYLSKFNIFLGPLTFGVYLIHTNNNVIINYLSKLLDGESLYLTANEVIIMLILKAIKVFIQCIIIEYLRHLLFTILKIRKICMFIEKAAFKISSFI